MPSPEMPLRSPALRSQVAMWGRHVQAQEVVRVVAEALGPDAKVMPLKGVLLGALGVLDPALRPISDVDVLVVGTSLTRAAIRLAKRGFRVADVPLAAGSIMLAPRREQELCVDLHVKPAPTALGRLSADIMFQDARTREDLFGAPVWVPTLANAALYCIVNVIKDRIVPALEHNAHDLAVLLGQLGEQEIEALATTLKRLSLARRAALALTWAEARTGDPHTQHLRALLWPQGKRRESLRETLRSMEQAEPTGGLAARLRARATADSPLLKVAAPLAAGRDVLSWPLRQAWFTSLDAWLHQQP